MAQDQTAFRIILGTYERLLYGLDAVGSPIALNPVFIYPAHITCIKAAAATARYLATGSTDEHIKLYDLRLRKEIGTLMHHSGSITCLKFFQKSHLITASEDGTISIVRTRDWEVLKTLDGHKRAVRWVDVHPSGKVLLSVGGDGTLKCWDLAKGTCAYSMKLSKPAERVCWSPSGDRYAVLMDRLVQICNVQDGEVVANLEGIGRINAIAFCQLKSTKGEETMDVVVTGGEDRTVGVWRVNGDCVMRWATGHGNRIKDLGVYAEEGKRTMIVTCSSDGGVRVWDSEQVEKQIENQMRPSQDESTSDKPSKPIIPTAKPETEYDAKCRLTCVTVAGVSESSASATDGRHIPVQANEKQVDGAAKSEAESDYDEQIQKPTISVSFETDEAKDANGEDTGTKGAAKDTKPQFNKKRKATSEGRAPESKRRGPQPPKGRGKGKQAALEKFKKRQTR